MTAFQTNVDPRVWSRLYELAGRVQAMAPWSWMEETDIFGVEIPGTDKVVFISVMGAIGEHFSVALYPGIEGLSALWALHSDDHAEPERVLEIPQTQLSFENRVQLRQEDHRILKQLGLRFRGKNAWPLFRSYRPGFVPWFIDADEAELFGPRIRRVTRGGATSSNGSLACAARGFGDVSRARSWEK